MRFSPPRTVGALTVAAAGLIALTGCSFSGSASDPDAAGTSAPAAATSPATSSPAPTATTSRPAPSSTAGAGATTGRPPATATPSATGASAAVDRCHTSELTGSLRAGDAAAGNRYATLVLTDTGGQTCTVEGFGGLGLVDASGRSLPTVQARSGGPGAVVTLRPGASVSAQLHWGAVPSDGDAQTGDCQPVPATLRVIPPDETDALSVAWSGGPVCAGGTIQETAYSAG
jgi:hypothetical protein